MMLEGTRLLTRGAAIALTIVYIGHAYAGDANQSVSERRVEPKIEKVTDTSSEHRPRVTTTASNDSDSADVIEEIIVIGARNRQRPNRGNNLTTPVLEKSNRFDWRFLPLYDPESADRRYSFSQHDELTGHAGIIDLFRLRFGRRR